MHLRLLQLCLMTMAALACDSRTVMRDDGGADGRLGPRDISVVPDRAPALDSRPSPDGPLPDLDECGCVAGQVWLMGPCVPTEQLGCGERCDPATRGGGCPTGFRCDERAAAACCDCSALAPACVPETSTARIAGGLRISPTDGVAGDEVMISVSGYDFYVGALSYMVRIGGEELMVVDGASCVLGVRWTPPAPNVYPVEVSQYGGGAPWVLAGFFTASGGVVVEPSVQPGFACATNPAPGDPRCVYGGSYLCECPSGRCVCERP